MTSRPAWGNLVQWFFPRCLSGGSTLNWHLSQGNSICRLATACHCRASSGQHTAALSIQRTSRGQAGKCDGIRRHVRICHTWKHADAGFYAQKHPPWTLVHPDMSVQLCGPRCSQACGRRSSSSTGSCSEQAVMILLPPLQQPKQIRGPTSLELRLNHHVAELLLSYYAGLLPLNTNSVPPMTLEESTPRL